MDDKIKWALLAVGAYFIYDWYTNQAPAAEVVPGGAPPTGTQPPVRATPGTPAPTPTPTPAPAPVTPLPPWHAPVYTPPAITPAQQAGLTQLSDAMIAQVAVSGAAGSDLAIAESVRRSQRYDFHQWNYFRSLEPSNGEQPDPASYYGGNAGDRVTAAEYMLVRKTALVTGIVQGMGGMGRHGGPILPFSTAWRA